MLLTRPSGLLNQFVRYRFTPITVAILIAIGFLYRFSLATLAFREFVFDSFGYTEWAKELLTGRFVIDCCIKNVGYSVVLAGIYRVFGVENILAVRLIHITLDLAAALLIAATAKRQFGSKVANIVFVLYIINPFTAAFTGILLAESLTIFYIATIAYILSRASFPTKAPLWVLFGFVLGILLFTRHSFIYFTFFLVPAVGILVIPRGRRTLYAITTLAAFVVASSYSLYGYWTRYRVVSIVPPHNLTYEIVYLNFFRWKYPEVEYKGTDPEYERVIQGYYNTPEGDRPAYSAYYKELFFRRLKTDWRLYLTNLAWNAVWLWDKDHLYHYIDPFYPEDRLPVRTINALLIFSFVVGITAYGVRKGLRALRQPVFLYAASLFLYITFLFSLLSNESRHTLAFYPLLILWAGYGIARIFVWVRRLFHTPGVRS